MDKKDMKHMYTHKHTHIHSIQWNITQPLKQMKSFMNMNGSRGYPDK